MYPASVLNPEFATAVRTHGVRALAAVAKCPYPTTLHWLLTVDLVPLSPLNVSRLKTVADAIGFDGPIFLVDDAS
jgi:hypothetical protein